jgi:hypothetical protein
MHQRCAIGMSLLLLAAVATPAPAGAADAKLDIIELHQTDAALAATYAKGKRMNLPRLLLLDAQGRLVLGEVGLRDGVDYRLVHALAKDKPLQSPITLALVLSEVVDAHGQTVAVSGLPQADGYVVGYWATWCAPCHLLARDIESQLKRWNKHVVWLKIESDPEKLPTAAKS